MKRTGRAFIALFLGMTAFSCAGAASNSFSPAQQKEIQNIVHDYLISNPEVLVEVSQALQEKEITKAKSQAMQGITQNKQKLFNNANSPTTGNANGDTVLVEFFDYQCGHCKTMQTAMESLLNSNKNVKIVFKEFPIFGASSNYASQMALAAVKQNKYLPFHNALFKANGALNETKVQEIAKSVGLNVDQLKKDMDSPEVKQEIADNYALAKALALVGTPAFVLSNKAMTQFDFIPGAASAETFQQAINNVSEKK